MLVITRDKSTVHGVNQRYALQSVVLVGGRRLAGYVVFEGMNTCSRDHARLAHATAHHLSITMRAMNHRLTSTQNGTDGCPESFGQANGHRV